MLSFALLVEPIKKFKDVSALKMVGQTFQGNWIEWKIDDTLNPNICNGCVIVVYENVEDKINDMEPASGMFVFELECLSSILFNLCCLITFNLCCSIDCKDD